MTEESIMAWIEVHQSLPTHKKTYKLARLTGADRTQCVGALVTLWLWALDNAPDGDLTDIEGQQLADIMHLDVEGSTLLEAMVECGFIDGDGERCWLHDWEEYAGRLIESRQKTKERHKRWRESRRRDVAETDEQRRVNGLSDVAQTVEQRVSNATTVPYPTVPNRTIPPGGGMAPAPASKTLEAHAQERIPIEVGAEALDALCELCISEATQQDIKRVAGILTDERYKHLDVPLVAADYLAWQMTVPVKSRHKDRIGALRKQCEMRREQPAYFKNRASSTPNALNGRADGIVGPSDLVKAADRDLQGVFQLEGTKTLQLVYQQQINPEWVRDNTIPTMRQQLEASGHHGYSFVVTDETGEVYRD